MMRRIVLLTLAVLLLGGCGAESGDTTTTITIGALLPLTGGLSSYGESADAALQVAVEDINAYLASVESSRRIALTVRNTESDPEAAFEALLDLSADDVSVIVGPMGSEELSAVGALSDRVGALLVSPSAGLPSLAVEDDNVFRMTPVDTLQALAVAHELSTNGIQAVALLARDGVWGDELAVAISERFADRGGTTVTTLRYDPAAAANDYRSQLDALATAADQAASDFGTNAVAVVFIGYDEGMQVFKQAASNAALALLPWYGTDGFVLNGDMLGDPQAAAFAAAVAYRAPMYAGDQVDAERADAVRGPVETSLGRPADALALLAYDAIWLAALAVEQSGGSQNPNTLANALPSVALIYNGATGLVSLDDAGDRVGGEYAFWTIAEEAGVYSWESATAESEE